MSFEIFTPIWSYVIENEENRKKSKILNFEKKWSGDMVDRYLSVKFGVNPFDGFREKRCLRTDGRKDDGRQRHVTQSSTKQS